MQCAESGQFASWNFEFSKLQTDFLFTDDFINDRQKNF